MSMCIYIATQNILNMYFKSFYHIIIYFQMVLTHMKDTYTYNQQDERCYYLHTQLCVTEFYQHVRITLFTCVVPVHSVQITTPDNETIANKRIGDPLTLNCTVTTVRGISSSVDIIWSTGGREVRRINNTFADIQNDSAVYSDLFTISSLSANDNRKVYQCTVLINGSLPFVSSDSITLIFPGKYILDVGT